MLVPRIFGENLFDDWFDFPQWPDIRDVEKAEIRMDELTQEIEANSADYLKLRSINLTYHLPQNIIKKLHIGDTRFTFQISNLFTWCAAGNDIDPEAYSPNSGTRSLPQPTTYSFGLSTSF